MSDIEVVEKGQAAPANSTYQVIAYPSTKLPEQYVPLVYSRWLTSFRRGTKSIKVTNSKEYYKHYHAYIAHLLSKPESTTRLAVLSDDQDVVLGFSVCRGPILDYVHVQVNHREQGIATKLVPKDIKIFGMLTDFAQKLYLSKARTKYKDIVVNPFA